MRAFYRWEEAHRSYLPAYMEYDKKQLSKMTHMEPFTYTVWEKEHAKPCQVSYVLFDYKERNPLTYQARTEIVREPDQGWENV